MDEEDDDSEIPLIHSIKGVSKFKSARATKEDKRDQSIPLVFDRTKESTTSEINTLLRETRHESRKDDQDYEVHGRSRRERGDDEDRHGRKHERDEEEESHRRLGKDRDHQPVRRGNERSRRA